MKSMVAFGSKNTIGFASLNNRTSRSDEARREYNIGGGQMERVGEFDGFDLDNGTTFRFGLMSFDLERLGGRCPDAVLTTRYARFGLHSYNMSHGTKLELHHIRRFNQTMVCQSTYYFTLAASDPAATTSLVTLQIGVAEGCRDTCSLNVRCFVARPHQGAPREPYNLGQMDYFKFPYWPSDFSDSQRFWQVNESEFQDNNNWIRLYLELVLCTNDRRIEEPDLSKLQILKVAIETIETNETLQLRAENVYITFKGFALARVGEPGEHVERKVIVRRNFYEGTGCMTLLGEYGFCIGEETVTRFISRPNKWAGPAQIAYIRKE